MICRGGAGESLGLCCPHGLVCEDKKVGNTSLLWFSRNLVSHKMASCPVVLACVRNTIFLIISGLRQEASLTQAEVTKGVTEVSSDFQLAFLQRLSFLSE